jgi:hypothetical protein
MDPFEVKLSYLNKPYRTVLFELGHQKSAAPTSRSNDSAVTLPRSSPRSTYPLPSLFGL